MKNELVGAAFEIVQFCWLSSCFFHRLACENEDAGYEPA